MRVAALRVAPAVAAELNDVVRDLVVRDPVLPDPGRRIFGAELPDVCRRRRGLWACIRRCGDR
jgi:hypothetical protein